MESSSSPPQAHWSSSSSSSVFPLAQFADQLYHDLQTASKSSPPVQTVQIDQVKPIVTYALNNRRWFSNTDHLLQLVTHAVIPNMSPDAVLEDAVLVASGCPSSGVCGVLWQKDEIAYKCRTCERDPTCVICDRCFRLGDHSGHDYAMVHTGGGCCDCGDPQAWRRDGFCSMHKGPSAESDDPTADLHPAFRQRLTSAVHVLAAVCVRLAVDVHRFKNESDSTAPVTRVAAMLKWLTRVARGDAICRTVGQILTETAPSWLMPQLKSSCVEEKLELSPAEWNQQSWLSLMLRMDGAERLPLEIQTNVQALYYRLMTDTVFKRSFFQCFVQNYERYMHAHVARRYVAQRRGNFEERIPPSDILEKFSVQLFTVPALVPLMIQPGGLLDILLHVLLNLFEMTSIPVPSYDSSIPYDKSAFAAKHPHAMEAFTTFLKTSASRHASNSQSRKNSSNNPDSDTAANSSAQLPHYAFLDSLSEVVHPLANSPDVAANNLDNPRTTTTQDTAPDQSPASNSGAVPELPTRPNLSPATVQNVTVPDENQASNGDVPVERQSEAFIPLTIPLRPSSTSDEDVIAREPFENFGNAVEEQDRFEEDSDEDFPDDVMMWDEDDSPFALGPENAIMADDHEALGRAVNVLFHIELDEVGLENNDRTAAMNLISPSDSTRASAEFYPQQVKVFEDGVHFKIPKFTRILPGDPPSSRVVTAATKARKMTSHAKNGTGPLAHPMVIEWASNNSKIDTELLLRRVLRDLNYILSHEAVAFHFLHQRPEPLRLFLRAVSMAQGMNPCSRRFGDHDPAWSGAWPRTVALEIELYGILELLAAAFCSRDASKYVEALGDSCVAVDLPASRRKVIGMFRSCLDEWFFKEQGIEALSTYAEEEFMVAHSQSVHFPLHRCLALFAHHAIRIDNLDVATALSFHDERTRIDDAKRLMLHPIRLHSFFAQVRAGMWRRNGRTLVNASVFYSSMSCSEWFVDLDLFLVQCCTLIVGPENFLSDAKRIFRIRDLGAVVNLARSTSKRTQKCRECRNRVADGSENQECPHPPDFERDDGSGKGSRANDGIEQYGLLPLAPRQLVVNGTIDGSRVVPNMGNSKSELAKFVHTIVEEFLVFVVRVSAERAMSGQSKETSLRSRLVQVLASRDKLYSVLMHTCSYSTSISNGTKVAPGSDEEEADVSEALIESILNQVADHIRPKGMEQGMYRLKDEFWKEFDPFCPRLSHRERCAAEVRHAAVCKKEKRKLQAIPMERICDRQVYKQFEELYKIPLVACGEGENAIATTLLQAPVPENKVSSSIEGVLAAGLHLLCMVIEVKDNSGLRQCLSEYLLPLSDKERFMASGVGAACQLSVSFHEERQDLHSEFSPVLERVIRQFYEHVDDSLKRLLAEHAPQILSSVLGGASDDTGSVVVSPEEKRRQFLMKKKREQQAAVMERIRRAQETFAKQIDEADLESDEQNAVKKLRTADNSGSSPVAMANSSGSDVSVTRKENGSHISVGSPVSVSRQKEQCLLCHGEGHLDDKDGLIGLIGFHQVTRIPAITKRVCNSVNSRNIGTSKGASDSDGDDGSSDGIVHLVKEAVSKSPEDISRSVSDQSPSEVPLGEIGMLSSMDEAMFLLGAEEGRNVHVSLCGHAVHVQCLDGYFQSLSRSRSLQAVFVGDDVVDLEKKEFLCPVCRRLSNLIWPIVDAPSLPKQRGDGETLGNMEKWVHERRMGIESSGDMTDMLGHDGTGGLNRNSQSDSEKREAFASLLLGLMKTFRFVKEPWASDPAWELPIHEVMAGFAGSVVSTAVCVEIGARTVEWKDSLLQHAKKSLRTLFQVTREHMHVENGVRLRALRILWKYFWQEKKSTARLSKTLRDAFVCLCLFLLLWSYELTLGEAKMIVRLVFEVIIEESKDGVCSDIESFTKGLLFLRRAKVLSWCVIGVDGDTDCAIKHYGNVVDMGKGKAELLELMDFFEIKDAGYRRIISDTKEDRSCLQGDLKLVTLPKRMGLIDLPQEFGTILEGLGKVACSMCKADPKVRVICLVCGDVVCSFSSQCQNGGASLHATRCGAGIGVFLSMKRTTVEIVRGDRRTSWGSPYLDLHGEEHQDLSRGRTLILCRERTMPVKDGISKLANLWEHKIQGTDEKGVHKAQSVDVPDDVVIVKMRSTSDIFKANSKIDVSPTTVTLGRTPSTSNVDNVDNVNNADKDTTVTPMELGPIAKVTSSSNSTRNMVANFEKMASDHMMERVSASTPHGVALRPTNSIASAASNDILRRTSTSNMSRRQSSIVPEHMNQFDELSRKVESMSARVTQLERQLSSLEKKFVIDADP